MPYPPQVFSLDGHAFGLTVNGVQIIQHVPTEDTPIRWDMPSSTTNGGISFSVIDTGETALPDGAVIRLTDNVNADLLFAGPLVNRRIAREGGPYRRVDVTGVGWGFYLDNRAVDEWTWEPFDIIEDYIFDVVSRFGGPVRPDPTTVNEYTVSSYLEAGTATKTTVRAAIDAIISGVGIYGDPLKFYVDNDQRLHFFRNVEDAVVGTATSVGDQGALLPEYLSYEVGSEGYKGFAYAYDVEGTALGVVPIGGMSNIRSGFDGYLPDWVAGEPSTIVDVPTPSDAPSQWASFDLYDTAGPVTTITFTTTEG